MLSTSTTSTPKGYQLILLLSFSSQPFTSRTQELPGAKTVMGFKFQNFSLEIKDIPQFCDI